MEKYSFEKARDEAIEIRKKAQEAKEKRRAENNEEKGEPKSDDYKNAEISLEEMKRKSERDDSQKIDKARADIENKYGREARLEEIKQQANFIRNWAESQNFKEGRDYIIIEDVEKYAEKEEVESVPHDIKRFAMGIHVDKVRQFRDFFVGEYDRKMKEIDPNNNTALNYSWGGRFCVTDAGVPCDTVIISDMETKKVETHHKEFKSFFKEKTGFDFPSGETLNTILKKIAEEGLSIYENVLADLEKKDADKTLPDNAYGLKDKIYHCIEILKRASKENQNAVTEMSETYTPSAEVHSYNDLTYNIEDMPDLDQIKEITGIEIPKEMQLDKIFEQPEIIGGAQMHFEKNKMDSICKEFSEYLINKRETAK